MKKFIKALLFAVIVAACPIFTAFAADVPEGTLIADANAEGEDPLCGYPLVASGAKELQIVKDPKNADNNVYYLEATVTDRKSWTYLWCDVNFKPGETYMIKYDILIEKDANGEAVATSATDACFRFADTSENDGNVKDHGIDNTSIVPGEWTTISMAYALPKTLDTSKQMRFGIFANPISECGVSFYVDNISVRPFVPETADDGVLKIFCVGNSLLSHGVAENLGWYGSWGMAATSMEKDYFHVMQSLFSEEFPDVEVQWYKSAASNFERDVTNSTETDYSNAINGTFGSKMRQVIPDIVTFQIGDNTPSDSVTAESYAHALEQAIDFCREVNPDVKIIISKHFYGSANDKKCIGAEMAAKSRNVSIVELYTLNKPENKAIGQYEHAGVANHPNDNGMQAVAETFYGVIRKFVLAENGDLALSVTVNNSPVSFKTAPEVVDGVLYVPLKETAEKLGYIVHFDESYKTFCVSSGKMSVIVPAGEKYAIMNDTLVTLSTPTKQADNDILVPSEFFDAVGSSVSFDSSLNTANISK